MDEKRREELNVKTIGVTLRSARLGLAKEDRRVTERGNALLAQARQEATSPAVLNQIEALQEEWDRGFSLRSDDEAR